MKHNYYFKYGTGRGQDSRGYRIVSLYVDGVKVAMSIGHGYDQSGDCLGRFLTKNYNAEITKLEANYGSGDYGGFYGLVHYDSIISRRAKFSSNSTKSYVDGMCGVSSVLAIASKIGVDLFETKPARKARS